MLSLGMSRALFVAATQATDVLSFVFGAYLAHSIRFGSDPFQSLEVGPVILSVILVLLVFPTARATGLPALENPWRGVKRMSQAFASVFVVLAIIGFSLQQTEQFSRLWVVSWIVATYFSLLCTRVWWSGFLKHGIDSGYLRERIALIHGRDQRYLDAIIADLRAHGFEIDALVPLYPEAPAAVALDSAPTGSTPRRFDDLTDFVHRFGTDAKTDRALLIPDTNTGMTLHQIAADLRMISLDVDVIPCGYDPSLLGRIPRLAGRIPVVNLMTRPLSDADVFVKRTEDLILGGLFLIPLLPVLALIALLVKLDSPGPVLFAQSRAGFNNVPFRIYKFRSMYVHDDPHVRQATRDDDRITRVGRVLRRTSLDELPQLFNVIRGSMSLVGPRPHALAHDREYTEMIGTYIARHRMKPGLTGWAQVNGWRGETDTLEKMLKRIEHDLYYVDTWSLFFDLKIIVLTLRVLYHRNAY